MAWLTKSRFLSGLQCHKRLWFEIHQPLTTEVDANPAILQGRSFDQAVQGLQPGTVIPQDRGLPAAIAETKKVLVSPKIVPAVLYQPAFRAGDLAVIVDVLRRSGSGFDLIEVKASTRVKETHIPDAAFQALVLQRANIPLVRVFIGHVNNQFVLRRVGDYMGLLTEVDVTDAVQTYLPDAAARALEFQEIMAAEMMPSIDVGAHCSSPYECPFLSRCHAEAEVAEYPIDVLPRGGKGVEALRDDGFRDLRDVPADRLTNEMHRRVYDATVSGLPFLDVVATRDLRLLPSPFSYLDFETISFSVPEVIGTRPFEQVPFQWSVHVEDSRAAVRHAEFLAIDNFGDFDVLAAALIAALPSSGPIFAYNAGFEERVLLRLADWTPGRGPELRAIADRLVDLLPITRTAYYHRDMRGSWSIKSVMPTIDTNLNYESLEEVQEGDGAQQAFLELRNPHVTPKRSTALKSALFKYCEHDTWVMMVLRRFLCGLSIQNLGTPAR
jgi:hypothetical protein